MFCLSAFVLRRFSYKWRRPEPQFQGSWWRRQGAWRGRSFMAAAAVSDTVPVAGRERRRGVTPSSTASITLPARPAPCVQPCQVTLRPAPVLGPPPSRSHRRTQEATSFLGLSFPVTPKPLESPCQKRWVSCPNFTSRVSKFTSEL